MDFNCSSPVAFVAYMAYSWHGQPYKESIQVCMNRPRSCSSLGNLTPSKGRVELSDLPVDRNQTLKPSAEPCAHFGNTLLHWGRTLIPPASADLPYKSESLKVAASCLKWPLILQVNKMVALGATSDGHPLRKIAKMCLLHFVLRKICLSLQVASGGGEEKSQASGTLIHCTRSRHPFFCSPQKSRLRALL